jgi:hypothetical protein
MQSLLPSSVARNPNSHTYAEILAALQAVSGSRRFSFRYELLDSTGKVVGQLDNVVSASIEENWLADIKRKAKFVLRETGGIDFLSDRIKPHVRLHLSPFGVNDYVEWPQGVFLLVSAGRNIDARGRVTREVEAYDLLQIFSDDLVTDRYAVAAGVNVVTAVTTLLGTVDKVVATNTTNLAVAKEWPPGTSKLKIINELLGMINYNTLSFNEDGQAVVSAYLSPTSRPAEYEYATDAAGLIVPNVDQELDVFRIPNKWVLVVSDPDRAPIIGTYTNTDPSSPTSTVRRQRTIVDFRTEQDATDATILAAKAARLAFEASQVYEAIDFYTGMVPHHSGNDVISLRYDPLAINAKYSHQSWSMELKAGAKMKHRARRVVGV